jgi:hypothetical protein
MQNNINKNRGFLIGLLLLGLFLFPSNLYAYDEQSDVMILTGHFVKAIENTMKDLDINETEEERVCKMIQNFAKILNETMKDGCKEIKK